MREDKIAKKGFFIVLEGLDGSGKSTQAKLLVQNLIKHGHDAVYMKEPTDGEWGQKIREIALKGRENVTPGEELDYFIKDREEDAEQNILPAIESGKVVVMDRYIYSNIAYQGALGIDIELIKNKNRCFPKPDIVFFLEASPEKGIGRINDKRTGGANVGYEKIEYLQKVDEIYHSDDFNFMLRIDAGKKVEEIQEEILEKVLVNLKVWSSTFPL
ncbi:MAG: dTMP kinase, partial [Nitrospinota bacterium]